jgi:hypothetical protein
MATPLNVFKTVTKELTTADSDVYTAPLNNTGIVLMAQVANITGTEANITFSHYNSDTTIQTELVKNFTIPGNDASSVITGKLVLETGHKIKAYSSSNDSLKLTLSILESLNA